MLLHYQYITMSRKFFGMSDTRGKNQIIAYLRKHDESITLSKEVVDTSPEYVKASIDTLRHVLINLGVDRVFVPDPLYDPAKNTYTYKAYGFEIVYEVAGK